MSNVVEIPRKINVEAVEILSGIIERVESGEITGVSVFYEMPDGTYNIEGSSTLSRLQAVGALPAQAVERLS